MNKAKENIILDPKKILKILENSEIGKQLSSILKYLNENKCDYSLQNHWEKIWNLEDLKSLYLSVLVDEKEWENKEDLEKNKKSKELIKLLFDDEKLIWLNIKNEILEWKIKIWEIFEDEDTKNLVLKLKIWEEEVEIDIDEGTLNIEKYDTNTVVKKIIWSSLKDEWNNGKDKENLEWDQDFIQFYCLDTWKTKWVGFIWENWETRLFKLNWEDVSEQININVYNDKKTVCFNNIENFDYNKKTWEIKTHDGDIVKKVNNNFVELCDRKDWKKVWACLLWNKWEIKPFMLNWIDVSRKIYLKWKWDDIFPVLWITMGNDIENFIFDEKTWEIKTHNGCLIEKIHNEFWKLCNVNTWEWNWSFWILWACIIWENNEIIPFNFGEEDFCNNICIQKDWDNAHITYNIWESCIKNFVFDKKTWEIKLHKNKSLVAKYHDYSNNALLYDKDTSEFEWHYAIWESWELNPIMAIFGDKDISDQITVHEEGYLE